MSIAAQIAQGLDRAFREKDFHSKGSILHVSGHGTFVFDWRNEELSIRGEILKEDSIGVLLNSLVIEKNVAERVTAPYLQKVAKAIEGRVNYLQEPLKLIELEPNTNAVQLRSEKPEEKEGTVSYFEVLLKSGAWFGHRNRLLFHRYAFQPEHERDRRVVTFPLTKAQLERLLDDLISAL